MARWNADFFRVYNEWYSQILATDRPGGLDARTRELVVIGGCAFHRLTPLEPPNRVVLMRTEMGISGNRTSGLGSPL